MINVNAASAYYFKQRVLNKVELFIYLHEIIYIYYIANYNKYMTRIYLN